MHKQIPDFKTIQQRFQNAKRDHIQRVVSDVVDYLVDRITSHPFSLESVLIFNFCERNVDSLNLLNQEEYAIEAVKEQVAAAFTQAGWTNFSFTISDDSDHFYYTCTFRVAVH